VSGWWNTNNNKYDNKYDCREIMPDAKNFRKIRPGAPNADGVGQNWRLSRKRYKIDAWFGSWIYALSNGPWPWVPPFSAFCIVIHSFVMGEPRDFKFDTVTNHSKSYPADSLKGAWWPVLEFYTPWKISKTSVTSRCSAKTAKPHEHSRFDVSNLVYTLASFFMT